MPREGFDVAVVGAGVIGLSVAYHLSRRGARVVVVERDEPGSGASQASAGMLAAQRESNADDAFFRLAVASRDLYPAFAEELREQSGIDIELERQGILTLTARPEGLEELRRRQAWQQQAGQPAEIVDARAAAELVPGIQGALGGLFCPRDGHVEPRRLAAALAGACRAAGVEIRCGVAVTNLQVRQDRVTGLNTPEGPVPAGQVLLAAGAATGRLAAGIGASVPIHPVKGQAIHLMSEGFLQGPWLASRQPVFTDHGYLVPKRGGRLILGGTVEPEAGFERRPTLGPLTGLAQAGLQVLPALATAPLLATTSGLRPGTPDEWPILGAVPGFRNLWLASGHFRNGILLTAMTGRLVAGAMLGESPGRELEPFSPLRFQGDRSRT